MTPTRAAIDTDAVLIGAGPVGLFQVFELGLLEIKAHVIDSLPMVGGRCGEPYPDKPIYDIPALPVCTGQQLTDNLLQQIAPFAPTFHLGQEVTEVQREDGRFNVATSTAQDPRHRDTRIRLTTFCFLRDTECPSCGAFSPYVRRPTDDAAKIVIKT